MAVATQPARGIATASGTSIIYTPAIGLSGVDAFPYVAANAGGISAPATVFVTVQ